MLVIYHTIEKGWHCFRTEQKTVDYAFCGSYETAIGRLIKHYKLKENEFVIIEK